jgi:hypothetical protein
MPHRRGFVCRDTLMSLAAFRLERLPLRSFLLISSWFKCVASRLQEGKEESRREEGKKRNERQE